jgi:hypothetical protein
VNEMVQLTIQINLDILQHLKARQLNKQDKKRISVINNNTHDNVMLPKNEFAKTFFEQLY